MKIRRHRRAPGPRAPAKSWPKGQGRWSVTDILIAFYSGWWLQLRNVLPFGRAERVGDREPAPMCRRLSSARALSCRYARPLALHNCALRAKAFAKEAGAERLIGGQTFLRGHVEGCGTKPHRADRETPGSAGTLREQSKVGDRSRSSVRSAMPPDTPTRPASRKPHESVIGWATPHRQVRCARAYSSQNSTTMTAGVAPVATGRLPNEAVTRVHSPSCPGRCRRHSVCSGDSHPRFSGNPWCQRHRGHDRHDDGSVGCDGGAGGEQRQRHADGLQRRQRQGRHSRAQDQLHRRGQPVHRSESGTGDEQAAEPRQYLLCPGEWRHTDERCGHALDVREAGAQRLPADLRALDV